MMRPTVESQRSRAARADVFDIFSVRPVVNCCGIYTDLGGSILSAGVWQSVEQLNGSFVRMTELMDRAGAMVASLVGAEAARITPGASAAIALSVAATMTGMDGAKWEQLPDTSGLKSEAVIARSHLARYKYAVCARLSGARLVAAGPADAYSIDDVLAAIGPSTACVLVPAHLLDGFSGVRQLRALVQGAHRRGVPVVVDAAYLSYPIDLLKSFASSGADLTCFSAKYYGGPNSGGFVSGSTALVAAVAGLDFTRFESGRYRSFGRPFKMSRYDVAATALALREWVGMNHHARLWTYRERTAEILAAVPDVDGVTAEQMLFTLSEELIESEDPNCVVISFAPPALPLLETLVASFAANDPLIEAVIEPARAIIAVDALLDTQVRLVADCIRGALGGR